MSAKFSPAERRALKLMASASHQDGIIDRYGNVVCDGEHKSISPATWLRLVAKKCVVGCGGTRLGLTLFGLTVAKED